MRDNSPRPHHLNLAVGGGDVARTADFYRNLLELTPVELPRDQDSYGAAIATLQDPGATSTTSSLMTPASPRVTGCR